MKNIVMRNEMMNANYYRGTYAIGANVLAAKRGYGSVQSNTASDQLVSILVVSSDMLDSEEISFWKRSEIYQVVENVPGHFCLQKAYPSFEEKHEMVGPMFSGNFAYTSDSRFPANYPLPIHDRYETVRDYDMLSR